jgi:hypothetical protein
MWNNQVYLDPYLLSSVPLSMKYHISFGHRDASSSRVISTQAREVSQLIPGKSDANKTIELPNNSVLKEPYELISGS